jgi:hypothetical protein
MKSGYVKSLLIATFTALGILPALAQARLVDLGARGYALNNSGEAALASGLYSNGTTSGSTSSATPLAINASGPVAGYTAGVLFGYGGGRLTHLLPPWATGATGSDGGQAPGINSIGTIVGWIDPLMTEGSGASGEGFSDRNGIRTQFYECPWRAGEQYGNRPVAISDEGQIAGTFCCSLSVDGCTTHLINKSVNEFTTVPLPAAVWVVGAGLLGFIAISRPRRLSAKVRNVSESSEAPHANAEDRPQVETLRIVVDQRLLQPARRVVLRWHGSKRAY